MKQSSQAHILTVIELDIVNKTFYQLAFYDRRLSRQSISTTLYVVWPNLGSGESKCRSQKAPKEISKFKFKLLILMVCTPQKKEILSVKL